ncbi:MAG: FAD-dependent monooxygenase [Cryobacterium sp.]|uniref:FAD-dependent oxidoreductase n=1 Tax=unclassified Cryobacterium TaxID=2649013 RepID=UPI0018CA5E4B|nr:MULTISPECIES: NAD(P)/FAD-dependent oxidoreductase [unclassified Cryobacterium]MCY7404774.1 FAD-dependent monooxygenase [Cryobacterium sp.]MEC5153620.1 2-polyprenyl-6-methoxyphenol hydroxylase-like FAD-dependent oxidoreductase [Cryobacterium sp. CAN_C3]
MRDVVIVGGGPVGTMLACVLAVGGLDVEVLEQREQPSLRSRAIGIHPPLLRALAGIGVADAVLERAVRIPAGEVRCDGRRLGKMSFERAAPGYPFVVALPQYETEALLLGRFEQLRPDRYRSGVTVTGVQCRGDAVELSTDSGPIEARYVIGADGARSGVRQAAGIAWRQLGRHETYLMGDFADPGPSDTGAVLYFERGGVVESFPLPGARRRWVAMTDFLAANADSADLAALIRHRTGVRVAEPLGAASAFAVQQRLAGRMHSEPLGEGPSRAGHWRPGPLPQPRPAGRIVLVGDAAHQISPIGGQGMNLGWLDAVALAPALQRALLAPGEAASVLADYDRTRRDAARRAVRQAAFNMQMGRPAHGLRLGARNALVRSLTLPPANELVARAFTMRWL